MNQFRLLQHINIIQALKHNWSWTSQSFFKKLFSKQLEKYIFGIFFNWKLNHSMTRQKKVGIWFYMFFFVHIPLLYQISTYTSLYTRIFNFSHSHYFHIPYVYQNSHIPTTYQSFLHIPAVYQSVKTPFFVFCRGQTFSWRIWSYFLDTSACISMTVCKEQDRCKTCHAACYKPYKKYHANL